ERLRVTAELVRRGARQLDRPAPRRGEARLHRVGRWRPGEDVAPRVSGVPQPDVAGHELRPPPDRGDEDRPARRVIPRRYVDDERRAAHGGPRHEAAAQLADDFGLAPGAEHGAVAT